MTTSIVAQLDTAVRAVAPILGVSIGLLSDKATWRIDFDPGATVTERQDAQGVVDAFDVTAVEADAALETTAVEALADGAQTDPVFTTLADATEPEIATFIGNTFPSLDTQQQAVLKLLLHFTVLELRRGS